MLSFFRKTLKRGSRQPYSLTLAAMTTEEISKFLGGDFSDKRYVKITFKKRDPIQGMFIKDRDYNDLSAKNFWRIVTKKNLDDYKKSKDINLAKIFSGSDFARLTPLAEI